MKVFPSKTIVTCRMPNHLSIDTPSVRLSLLTSAPSSSTLFCAALRFFSLDNTPAFDQAASALDDRFVHAYHLDQGDIFPQRKNYLSKRATSISKCDGYQPAPHSTTVEALVPSSADVATPHLASPTSSPTFLALIQHCWPSPWAPRWHKELLCRALPCQLLLQEPRY